MDGKYSFVFTGRLKAGTEPDILALLVSQRFQMEPDQARRLLKEGREVVLETDLDLARAEAYRREMDEAGMLTRVDGPPIAETLSLVPDDTSGQPEAQGEPVSSAPKCPKCGSDMVDLDKDTCPRCGIIISKYLRIQGKEPPPTGDRQPAEGIPRAGASGGSGASVARTRPAVADTAGSAFDGAGDSELRDPVSRPIGRGGGWIAEGWGYFRASPLAWILVLIVLFGINLALGLIPVVGSLASNALWPVFMGGLMLGCHAQSRGGPFEIGHLFAGFSRNTGQLLLLGVVYLAAILVFLLLFGLMAGSAVFMMDPEVLQNAEPEQALEAIGGYRSLLLVFLVMAAFFIPLSMATWFAPALIAIEGQTVISAMKQSFMGCIRNILPYLWFGLLAMILIIIAAIPFGLGLLVVIPMLMASIYAAYSDIFYD